MIDESISDLVARARQHGALSRSELARRTGSTRAALLEYEKGVRVPRADTFLRLLDATGATINVQLNSVSDTNSTLDSSLAAAVAAMSTSDADNWRLLVSDFVANDFVPATRRVRESLLAPEPIPHADARWNSFISALCEHLAFHGELPAPRWVGRAGWNSSLSPFWWPVHGEVASMRAAALSWSPASFRRRGIMVDGRELPVVTR